MPNKDFVRRKITLIQEDLKQLSGLAGFSFDEIVSDFYKQAALERILERVIMRAVDINQHLLLESSPEKIKTPKTYKETFTELSKIGVYSQEFGENLSKSVGTRNILVHEYDDKVDYGEIYDSVTDCLRDYRQYCDYILKFMDKADVDNA